MVVGMGRSQAKKAETLEQIVRTAARPASPGNARVVLVTAAISASNQSSAEASS